MEDTERDPDRPAATPRPAWVDEQQDTLEQGRKPRRERLPRQAVPGKHEDDGLWEHALEIGGIVTLGTFLAAILVPRTVPLWQITTLAAVITAAIWYAALTLTGSGPVALYLAAWVSG